VVILLNFVQPLNILLNDVTDEVFHVEIFKVINLEHFSNNDVISFTEEVLKWDIFKDGRAEHRENIFDIFSTFDVSK
jgi:hypothetical protein